MKSRKIKDAVHVDLHGRTVINSIIILTDHVG